MQTVAAFAVNCLSFWSITFVLVDFLFLSSICSFVLLFVRLARLTLAWHRLLCLIWQIRICNYSLKNVAVNSQCVLNQCVAKTAPSIEFILYISNSLSFSYFACSRLASHCSQLCSIKCDKCLEQMISTVQKVLSHTSFIYCFAPSKPDFLVFFKKLVLSNSFLKDFWSSSLDIGYFSQCHWGILS